LTKTLIYSKRHLIVFFNIARADNHDAMCCQPLFHSVDYAGLFQMIGFDGCLVHPKTKPFFWEPESAPEGQHPTGFLQYGVRIESKRHVVFEMADYHYLVQFDFKEVFPEGKNDPIYQIDGVEIHDGDVEYSLDCDDVFYRPYVVQVMDIVKHSMSAMTTGEHECAKSKFQGLQSIVQNLDEISAKVQAKMIQEEMDARAAANDAPRHRF